MSGYIASRLKTSSGADLRVFTCAPKAAPKACVQIAHGMCEHAGRYERFALALADAGYKVYAFDHRGHGETKAVDAPLGSFAAKDGWQKVLSDMADVNQHIRSENEDLPVICFGHSMGSTITASFVLNHPTAADAAAIWNGSETGFLPNLLVQVLKIERWLKGSDVASTWADALTFQTWNKEFKPNRTPSDWLSRDEAEVDKYVADPLCGFAANIGLWLDLLTAMNDLANTSKMKSLTPSTPFHILGGDQDPVSSKGKAIKQLGGRLKAAGLTDVKEIILPDTRHESLNEINRDEVTADFIKWLDERFS